MLLSIICVYNNKELLESMLLTSIEKQDVNYELIFLDNRHNKFKSAAEALNYGGSKAKGDILIFVHQDIEFYDGNLKDIIEYCKSNKNLGVAGVAGVSAENNGRTMSNILHGENPTKTKNPINEIKHVQTLDELLLIVPKTVFDKYKFDEETCYNWHLYGADYCLNLKKNGYDIILLPLVLYHLSPGGSMSLDYYRTLKKCLNKYKEDYEIIYTTCLLSHNPKNQTKLNLLYYLEILHLKQPIMHLLENFNFLKRFLK